MNKKKSFRLLTAFALCMVLVCSFSMTAFAYADDTDQNLPVTEATQPEETTEPETTVPPETITPVSLLRMRATPTLVICSMTRLQINSSLPSRQRTAIPFISLSTTMRPSTTKRNSIRLISSIWWTRAICLP